jgi:arylsulfatase B
VPFNAPHSPFQAKPEDIARFAQGKKAKPESIYHAMIWSMDQGIGKILKAIDETGEADNTQVWFMSDNGGVGKFKRNNRPLHGSKLTTFEGGVRVAAGVRWPARWRGGRRLENTVGYIDVLPTVLASAGIEPAGGQVEGRELDGISLCELLEGTSTPGVPDVEFPERDWYSYHGQSGAHNETIAVKTAAWKLVVTGPDIRTNTLGEQHKVYLFKMPSDLLEKQNLATQKPEVVDLLLAKLKTYRSLQPSNGVTTFADGKKGFVPWKDWRITPPK